MTHPPNLPDITNCLFPDKTFEKKNPGCHLQQADPPAQSIDPSREPLHQSMNKAASAIPIVGGLDHSEESLKRLSARPYSVRMSDPNDFAHAWETTLEPLLVDVLKTHYGGYFSLDVYNFPELDGNLVPCVIFVSLPVVAPTDLQDRIRAMVAAKMPSKFHHTQLKFQQSTLVQSNWWGTDSLNPDPVCDPKNHGFQAIPTNGASVGSKCSAVVGTLGGVVMVGDKLYGMSCRHVFEEAISTNDLRVVHSGPPSLHEDNDTNARELDMGELKWYSEKRSVRQSFTYQGTDRPGENRVGMDWCLFGPVPEGRYQSLRYGPRHWVFSRIYLESARHHSME
ncbi:hypothetical protein DL546_004927 [Coniochaeta pulveracea]|uniref:Uncharacterized protein n=1 Tax=Coniochaeta pulveracea TaxID=177199 RepID=A0A420YCT0_9PEZI|nr:hypothetical protein DL546_004927 [Coniochaeta pulveracea]